MSYFFTTNPKKMSNILLDCFRLAKQELFAVTEGKFSFADVMVK